MCLASCTPECCSRTISSQTNPGNRDVRGKEQPAASPAVRPRSSDQHRDRPHAPVPCAGLFVGHPGSPQEPPLLPFRSGVHLEGGAPTNEADVVRASALAGNQAARSLGCHPPVFSGRNLVGSASWPGGQMQQNGALGTLEPSAVAPRPVTNVYATSEWAAHSDRCSV